MAHPEHIPILDLFDKVQVILYRTGLVITSITSAIFAIILILVLYTGYDPPMILKWPLLISIINGAILLSISNIHIYSKLFRWTFTIIPIAGIYFQFLGGGNEGIASLHPLSVLGFGGMLAVLGALAWKEHLCFKIPLARVTPLVCFTWFIGLALSQPWIELAGSAGVAILTLILSFKKMTMPIHYDVGRKDLYEA